jgi:hypothetical protein
MATVTITPVTTTDELFCHYNGEHHPQGCYLALDLEEGGLTCSYNAAIGNGVPFSVWHGRTIRWTIPCLTSTYANQLMDNARELAQRIIDDTEIEWNELCTAAAWGPETQVAEYSADDWYTGEGRDDAIGRLGLTADTTDQQIADMVKAEIAEAATGFSNDGYVVLTGVEDWLIDARRELREQICDDLKSTAERLTELTERRNSLIRRIGGWEDAAAAAYSTRTIGDLANLSHTHVQRIIASPAP